MICVYQYFQLHQDTHSQQRANGTYSCLVWKVYRKKSLILHSLRAQCNTENTVKTDTNLKNNKIEARGHRAESLKLQQGAADFTFGAQLFCLVLQKVL